MSTNSADILSVHGRDLPPSPAGGALLGPDSSPAAGSLDEAAVLRVHRAILEMTEQLFGAPAVATREADPEMEGEHLVINVSRAAEVVEFVRLNDEWHGRLVQLAGPLANHYRLAIDPR